MTGTPGDPTVPPARRRGWVWWFVGAALFLAVAVGLGGFFAGWSIATQTAAASRPEVETVEVPVIDPMAGDAVMPDVRGLDVDAALQVIADAGTPVSAVTTTTRPAAGAPGLVIEQTPAFGTASPAAVTLVISEAATVPELTGTTARDAEAQLSVLGAAVAREGAYDPNAPEGAVLAVSPAAGEPLAEQVTLTVNVAPASTALGELGRDGSCSSDEDVLMGGTSVSVALQCSARKDGSTTAWLLAGAVDRITGTIGIADEQPVGTRSTVTVALDGAVIATYDAAWGAPVALDLRTSGALKLEITVTGDDRNATAVLGDVLLLGDPTAMTRLRES